MADSQVYDNYLGGEIVTRDAGYEVLVGPWRTMVEVHENDWLKAHDEANNWRLKKADKFRSWLEHRKSIPLDIKVLPYLLKKGYGPFLVEEELDDDRVTERYHYTPSISPFWEKSMEVQILQADETHREHGSNNAYAATEWAAISGRSFEILVSMYNRTDIGNLTFMALHAPRAQRSLFQELHENLTAFSKQHQE